MGATTSRVKRRAPIILADLLRNYSYSGVPFVLESASVLDCTTHGATVQLIFNNDFTLVEKAHESFGYSLRAHLADSLNKALKETNQPTTGISIEDFEVKKLERGSVVVLLALTTVAVVAILVLPTPCITKVILLSTFTGAGVGAAFGCGVGTVVPVAGNGVGGVGGGFAGFVGGVLSVII